MLFGTGKLLLGETGTGFGAARARLGGRRRHLFRSFPPRMEHGDRMKLLLSVFFVPALFSAPMPAPWKSMPGAGHLTIDSSFAVEVRGFSDPRVDAAVRRFTARIARQTGIPIIGGKPILMVESAPQRQRRILSAGYFARKSRARRVHSRRRAAWPGNIRPVDRARPRWIPSSRAFTSKIIRDFRGAG